MTLEEAVWVDAGRMSGAPCFRGTRLPVRQLFDWLADGTSLDEFAQEFRIDRAAAELVLRAAGAALVQSRVKDEGEAEAGERDKEADPMPAFGMWQDREDMADVQATVREWRRASSCWMMLGAHAGRKGMTLEKAAHNSESRNGRRAHPEVYAFLWLTRASEASVERFLISQGIKANAIQKGMHLTVYHARCLLPGLRLGRRPVKIVADIAETRMMVMAPGGERPRDDLDPRRQSVGIRLTKRNRAIEDIQALRREIYRLETPAVLGLRKPTTAWTSAFGARGYQPHIKVIRPESGVPYDLTLIGSALRASLQTIGFGVLEVRYRP